MSEEAKHVAVIGGGITGLAIAYLALKSGKQVTVFEAGDRFGGLLDTFEVGGSHLEKFYHHFFLQDAELNWLLGELDLLDQRGFYPSSVGVYREGEFYDFNGVGDLFRFKPIGFFGAIRFGVTSLFLGKLANWRNWEKVSALDWFRGWSGSAVTESIWKPLLNVKFGSHAGKVPLSWMIGRLRQRMASRNSGGEKLGYLNGSLKILCDALVQKLEDGGAKLMRSSPVSELNIINGRIVGLHSQEQDFKFDQVISTIPGTALEPLLVRHSPKMSAALSAIEYFGAVCVILEMDTALSSHYWLNVADDSLPFGGVIEQTNLIPKSKYSGKHIVYLTKYFAKSDPIAKLTEEEIKGEMISGVSRMFPDFQLSQVTGSHAFRTNNAATVCDLHFSKKVLAATSDVDGLHVANMSHIYPDERSVNNSIRVASNLAKRLNWNYNAIPDGQSLSGTIGL